MIEVNWPLPIYPQQKENLRCFRDLLSFLDESTEPDQYVRIKNPKICPKICKFYPGGSQFKNGGKIV
eukprot:UN00298